MDIKDFVNIVKEKNLKPGDEIILNWGIEKSKHLLNQDFFDWLTKFSFEKKSVGLISNFNFQDFENSGSAEYDLQDSTIFNGKRIYNSSPLKVKLSYQKEYFYIGADEIHHVLDIELINLK